MKIELENLARQEVRNLVRTYLASMRLILPPNAMHAASISGLEMPSVTCWSAWEDNTLLGFGALKELTVRHGEIKSMCTAAYARRRGTARTMLTHLIAIARSRSYEQLSLATGQREEFAPARRLYETAGFRYCPPFANYLDDGYNVFMTMRLEVPSNAA